MTGRIFALIAVAALAVAGCEGDDGATGPQGPAGLGFVPTPTATDSLGEYDSGVDPADPADDPADQEVFAKLFGNLDVWEIALDGQVQFDFGDGTPPVVGDTLIYDSGTGTLWITVDGTDIPLTVFFASIGCAVPGVAQPCVTIDIFVAGGDYAMLSAAFIETPFGSAVDTVGFGHYGVKTADADMPTVGTAVYSGDSVLIGEYTRPNASTNTLDMSGSVDITVVFSGAVDQVDWNAATGAGDFSYDLDGTATIAGNSYSGTLTGTVIGDADDALNTLSVAGDFSGNFYGPAADDGNLDSETAGVFDGSDVIAGGTATGSVVGGFWADQDSYTP